MQCRPELEYRLRYEFPKDGWVQSYSPLGMK